MHIRKPSPGTAIALLALFFAMGGTAIAAHHYLITKTSQIKPSVLKALKKAGPKGATGVKGETGLKGDKGDKGEKGETGAPGGFIGVLPSGKTMRGTLAAQGPAGQYRTSVSFLLNLPAPPEQINYVKEGEAVPAGCAGGTVAAPAANPGNLCIFEGVQSGNSANRGEVNPINDEAPDLSAPVYGFGVYSSCESGSCVVEGTWAVTAK